MASRDFFDSADDVRLCVHELASELGLTLVKRKSQVMLGVYALSPLGMEGYVEGMPFGATIAHRHASLMAGGTALVAFELVTEPPLWVDLHVSGKGVPTYEPDDFLAEFEVRTDDRNYAGTMFDAPLKAAMLEASWAGFYPTVTDRLVRLQAVGLGSQKELRSCFRSATKLGRMIRERQAEISRSRTHAQVAEAWLTTATQLGGTLDEETMVLSLELTFGRLQLRLRHPAYGRWETELSLEFEPKLPGEFRVTSYSGKWDRWFATDVKLGDPAFDDRFLVRASAKEVAERYLSESARARLLTLSERMPRLLLSESGLLTSNDRALGSAEDARRVIDIALSAAEELLRQRESKSAYR